MDKNGVLWALKKQIEKESSVTLSLPNRFSFKEHDVFEFEEAFGFFDWSIKGRQVKIDFTTCKSANYQTLSLLVLYQWYLKDQGCTVSSILDDQEQGASSMWRTLGGLGTFPVLFNPNQTFVGRASHSKPMIPLRGSDDFKKTIEQIDKFSDDFNVKYTETLRYVVSELLYNTLEHGKKFASSELRHIRIPSIVNFSWYASRRSIHILIGDIGVGIKNHIEQAYPGLASDVEAIQLAIKPQKSGTFGKADPYTDKNNAGMGLYISSNIIKRLNADMHIISGNGLLHISPRDITERTLKNRWPGTVVLVTLNLEDEPTFVLHNLMQEFRELAKKEQQHADEAESENRLYFSVEDYFGKYAEDKEAAIKFKEKYIFPAIDDDKLIVVDFNFVVSSPHSFLSALLASPIKRLGMGAYKKIKIINASPEIRETIDFIFDDNT